MADFIFNKPIEFNQAMDRQKVYTFSLKVRDSTTKSYLDISSDQFSFTLKKSDGATIWNLVNENFARPDINTVTFSKTVEDLALVPAGSYTISLKVTNDFMTANEVMFGTWQFKDS